MICWQDYTLISKRTIIKIQSSCFTAYDFVLCLLPLIYFVSLGNTYLFIHLLITCNVLGTVNAVVIQKDQVSALRTYIPEYRLS